MNESDVEDILRVRLFTDINIQFHQVLLRFCLGILLTHVSASDGTRNRRKAQLQVQVLRGQLMSNFEALPVDNSTDELAKQQMLELCKKFFDQLEIDCLS